LRPRMKRVLAIPVMAGAIALALLAGAAVPAQAKSAAAAIVTGAGTISPGLTSTGTPQSYTFTSALISTVGKVAGKATVLGASNCTSYGGSNPGTSETTNKGKGYGWWGCSSGPLTGVTGTLTYTRVGAVVAVVLSGGLTGALACVFTPNPLTQTPVTHYDIRCAGAGEGP
jgi:hypothetical protein